MVSRNSSAERRVWAFAYAPLIFWIAVILLLGSGAGSMTQTSLIIGPLLELLFPSASPETRILFHSLVRKAAHLVEYAILGFLSVRALRPSSGVANTYRFALTVLIVAVIASIDEFNQSFLASRTSSFWDVLLDVAGGLFGIAVSYLVIRRKKRPDDITARDSQELFR